MKLRDKCEVWVAMAACPTCRQVLLGPPALRAEFDFICCAHVNRAVRNYRRRMRRRCARQP